jgi:hypothetical protein
MRFVRYVSLIDVVTAVMVLFILLLPSRTMLVAWAAAGTEPARYSLAIAEARSIDDRKDGELISELSRRLGEAGFGDWAVEAAARGSVHADGAPSQWRALMATSVAYVERLDAVLALDYARQALAACATARAVDERVCPSWEEVKMDLYARHLDAGVASGIDARKDPAGFRRAGEAALRTIHVGEAKSEVPAPVPAPVAVPVPVAPQPGGAGAGAPAPAAPPR